MSENFYGGLGTRLAQHFPGIGAAAAWRTSLKFLAYLRRGTYTECTLASLGAVCNVLVDLLAVAANWNETICGCCKDEN